MNDVYVSQRASIREAPLAPSVERDVSFEQLFADFRRSVPFDLAVVVSTMPRGGLQVIWPGRVQDRFVKRYHKAFGAEDRQTWRTILQGRATAGAPVQSDGTADPFFQKFLKPLGYESMAVAPLSAPIFKGFPGAVQLYRKIGGKPFNDNDLAELTRLAGRLDEQVVGERASRSGGKNDIASRTTVSRQFIFDAKTRQILPTSNLDDLDRRLVEQMVQHARHLLSRDESTQADPGRLSLPDSDGDLWNFRVAMHRRFPALSDGPVVFFNLIPAPAEWVAIRATDVAADTEMVRLLPSVEYMHTSFAQRPTLKTIARVMRLSPFHFHRRFTALFGLTPKHFLLDCQIVSAKRELLAGRKELVDVAKACGFAHQSHFTSRFKQATGLTPTRWRRLAMATYDRV